MADVIVDGRVRVSWVPTITTLAAPTAAQLNAGTSLETLMTPDGLVGFEPTTAEVDNTSLDSTFDTVAPGRAQYSGCALRLKKQGAADAVYAALTRDAAGYVVVRRDIAASTAWTAAQKVEVYPAVLGETRNLAPEKNAVQKYEVPVMVTAAPAIRAVVA
jgi:hypothetical protein